MIVALAVTSAAVINRPCAAASWDASGETIAWAL